MFDEINIEQQIGPIFYSLVSPKLSRPDTNRFWQVDDFDRWTNRFFVIWLQIIIQTQTILWRKVYIK